VGTRIAAFAVLFAWVCIIHSGEAVPIRAANLDSEDAASSKAAELAAIEKQVEAVGSSNEISPSETQEHEIKSGVAKVNSVTGSKRLSPGDPGYLQQQIEGPDRTFKQVMTQINKHLRRKALNERNSAYAHAEAATLAREASRAVGAMAREVSSDAEQTAEEKAAAASECTSKLAMVTDEAEKARLAKECKARIEAKKAAYDEAAQAEQASTSAIDAAGAREGEVKGLAGFYQDGTSKLIHAKNAAQAAQIKLKSFEKQMAIDAQISQRRLRQDREARMLQNKYQQAEQAAQDRYDLRVAKDELKDPPPAIRVRSHKP
jgi:hypothetical protein